MKVAIIGSRNLTISDLETYLPKDTTEIISGGARGTAYVIGQCLRIHKNLAVYTPGDRGGWVAFQPPGS